MDDRLRTAFATAMKARHETSGTVQAHFGPDVIDYLRSFAIVPDSAYAGLPPTCWGFPVLESAVSPDHISIHTVQTIY